MQAWLTLRTLGILDYLVRLKTQGSLGLNYLALDTICVHRALSWEGKEHSTFKGQSCIYIFKS